MQAAWLLRLLSGSQMALQKKGAALREVVGKPPWELCHQSPSPTTCLHPAARQVGRSVATCARSLNVQRVCVCGISGCGRVCIVGLPRRPCGAGIDIPQLARQCRVLPGAAPASGAARHLRSWCGTQPQLASPELTPTCHPARFSSQQGQKVKKGSGRFWLWFPCSRK